MATGRQITDKEKENLIICLNMRKNYIETGDIAYCASDVEQIGKCCGVKINALTPEQMKLILDIEELKEKIFKKKIIIVD